MRPRPAKGLEVYGRLDDGTYPNKIHVTDADLEAVNIRSEDFHPEWNHAITKHYLSTSPYLPEGSRWKRLHASNGPHAPETYMQALALLEGDRGSYR